MKLPKLPAIPNISPAIQKILPKPGAKDMGAYTIVDVGAATVRAAVIELNDDGVVVLGRGQAKQNPQTMYGGVVGNLDSLIEAIDGAMSQANNRAGVSSDQLILGLGGAMVCGITTLVHLNRPQAREKITAKEFNMILERISQTALVDAENTASEEMSLEKEELRLVNAAITSISLDGYTVSSPIGFSGKEVEICLFNAFIAQNTLVVLQKILTELSVDLAALTSGPYALAELVVATAKKPQLATGLIVDIGAGSTSVTLVEHGAVVGSKSYPLGGLAITKHLASSLEMSIDEAEKVKKDYAQGKVLEEQQKKIHPIVTGEVDLWLQGLGLALAELQHDNEPLPEVIHMTGGGSTLPDIEQRLKQEKWAKKIGFAEAPKIEYIRVEDIPGLVDESHVLEQTDSVLAALALFWQQRQKEDGRVSDALQKTLESLG